MGIRIPKNQIITGKYTTGKEYVILSSHAPYQGFYYELNGRTFAGKEFDPKAPEIIRMTSGKFNPLLGDPNTMVYANISKIKLDNTEIKSIPFVPTADDLAKPFMVRYFVKKLNDNPIAIKEVTQDTFEKAQSNPLYQTLKVNFSYGLSDEELNAIDKQMTGLGAYLASDEPDTSGNEPTEFNF
jgi:hypothetical protein